MRNRIFDNDSVYCHSNYIGQILLITTRNCIDNQFGTCRNFHIFIGIAYNVIKFLLVRKYSFSWVCSWIESNLEINQSKVALLASDASVGQPTCLHSHENLAKIVSETCHAQHMKHFTGLIPTSALTFYCYRVH